MTTRDAEVAILATERILERTEEVAPSILLGKTLRIGKAILSENIQEDLVHEAATLGNYMAMVQKDLEELKKKVKVQFTPVAEFKDPKYMAGMDLVQQVDMRHNPHLFFLLLIQVHLNLVNQSHDIDMGVQRIAPKLTK